MVFNFTEQRNRGAIGRPPGGGVTLYNPAQQVAQRQQQQRVQRQQRSTGSDGEFNVDNFMDRYLSGQLEAEKQAEEENQQSIYGRGLGFVVNNPVTQAALKPLQVLDYGRRAIALGVDEGTKAMWNFNRSASEVEGDEQSNWEKLNDPTYGMGDIIPDVSFDDNFGNAFDKGAGFLGDLATDPLSYVGGIGFATKGMSAGGRAAKTLALRTALNNARRSGASADDIAKLVARGETAMQKGFGAADPKLLDELGVRGGIRMTTNPFSPYSGKQVTIKGSEKLTAPLSRARTATGNVIGKTRAGRFVQDVGVPDGLESAYARVFRNEGSQTMEEALDYIDHVARVKQAGAAFADPFVRQADRLERESRKLTAAERSKVLLELETDGAKLGPFATKMRAFFDRAHAAAEGLGLDIQRRENYSPHILTRDAIDWRKGDSANIKAPEGFFTEAKYSESGVAMTRKFRKGDEFEVNGRTVKIEDGTIDEVNRKFREAGLKFDFYETDPGVIAHKYMNMLSDDVGVDLGTKDFMRASGGRGNIFVDERGANSRQVLGGGDGVKEGDLARIAGRTGGDLDPERYAVKRDKELTDALNDPIKARAKADLSDAKAELKATRKALTDSVNAAAAGKDGSLGGWGPSVKEELAASKKAVTRLNKESKKADRLLAATDGKVAPIEERIRYAEQVQVEVDDSLREVVAQMEELRANAPREFMAELESQRSVLQERFDDATRRIDEARQRADTRVKFAQGTNPEVDARRTRMYNEAGVEEPKSGLLPGATGKRVGDMGAVTAPAGHQQAAMERVILKKMDEGKFGKGVHKRVAELANAQGKTFEEVWDDLTARVARTSAKPTNSVSPIGVRNVAKVPPYEEVEASIKSARAKVMQDAKDNIDRISGGEAPPHFSLRQKQTRSGKVTKKSQAEASKKAGEWDELGSYYEGLRKNQAGKLRHREMVREKLISNNPNAQAPDQWLLSVNERMNNDIELGEAIDLYFKEAEKWADAKLGKTITDDVAWEASQATGLPEELIVASHSKPTYNTAKAKINQGMEADLKATGESVADMLPQENRDVITAVWDQIAQDESMTAADRSAGIFDMIQDDIEAALRDDPTLGDINEIMQAVYSDGAPSFIARLDEYRLRPAPREATESVADVRAARAGENRVENIPSEGVGNFPNMREPQPIFKTTPDGEYSRLDTMRKAVLPGSPEREALEAQLKTADDKVAKTTKKYKEKLDALDHHPTIAPLNERLRGAKKNGRPVSSYVDLPERPTPRKAPVAAEPTIDDLPAELQDVVAGVKDMTGEDMANLFKFIEDETEALAAKGTTDEMIDAVVEPPKPKALGEELRVGTDGKVAIPKGEKKNPPRKEFWDQATQDWIEAVDDALPPMGRVKDEVVKGARPQKHKLSLKMKKKMAQVSKRIGLDDARAALDEALQEQALIRSQLDRKVFTADDPAVRRKAIERANAQMDPGEKATISRLAGERRQEVMHANELNAADSVLAREAQGEQRAALEGLQEVGEQRAEVIKSPQRREQIRQDAVTDGQISKQIRLEAETNAAKTTMAAEKANLGAAEKAVLDAQAGVADINAGLADANKMVADSQTLLKRLEKLKPTDRELSPEAHLRHILEQDPGLKDVSNQATVFTIMEAEKQAAAIPGILKKIEDAGTAGKGEHLSRVLDTILTDSVAPFMPDLFGNDVPLVTREFMNMLQTTKKITSDNKFWKMLDNMTGLFKTYATATPGFHVRNAMSAAFMNASDGVPTGTQLRAIRIMREYGEAVKQGDEALDAFIKRQGKVVLDKKTGTTVKDALDAVAGTGAGGRYREAGVGDRTLARHKFNEWAYENRFTLNVGKRPGTFVESAVRLPAAMDTLIRGGSVEQAVQRTKRLHFDYSETSKFDKHARRLIPFWTFMSRNLPLQVSQMYTNPRAYAKYNSFVRNLAGNEEPGTPEYFNQIGAFRFGGSTVAGLPVYLQPDLPHTRLGEEVEKVEALITGGAEGNRLRAFSDFNPMFTAPAEYLMGRDLYTGRQFQDDDLREAGLIEKPVQWLGELLDDTHTTPGGNKVVEENLLNAIRAVLPVYDRSVRLAPQLTTGGNDAESKQRQAFQWARTMGLPVRGLTPGQQESTARNELFQQYDDDAMQRALAAFDN